MPFATNLTPWQWALLALGASLVGISKTGVAGVGSLTVAIFANVLPARESTGVVLPLLVCADVVAVTLYRRHAVWKHLWPLFPWAIFGIVMGYLAMDHINDRQMRRLIGGILIAMVALHLWRQLKFNGVSEEEAVPHRWWFAALTGILAGFTTMIANAAGPVMILYLLSMRLPKMEFLGTGAWYFFLLNLFKLPFSANLGLIHASTLHLNLILAPFAVLGAVVGRMIIPHINQKLFEQLALAFTLLAGLRLCF